MCVGTERVQRTSESRLSHMGVLGTELGPPREQHLTSSAPLHPPCFVLFRLMYASVFLMCVSVFHACAGAHGGWKRTSDPLEVELPCASWE